MYILFVAEPFRRFRISGKWVSQKVLSCACLHGLTAASEDLHLLCHAWLSFRFAKPRKVCCD